MQLTCNALMASTLTLFNVIMTLSIPTLIQMGDLSQGHIIILHNNHSFVHTFVFGNGWSTLGFGTHVRRQSFNVAAPRQCIATQLIGVLKFQP